MNEPDGPPKDHVTAVKSCAYGIAVIVGVIIALPVFVWLMTLINGGN